MRGFFFIRKRCGVKIKRYVKKVSCEFSRTLNSDWINQVFRTDSQLMDLNSLFAI
jgi:hypothetical protein